MRAGRTFVEALGTLADRLMIPEARSLVGSACGNRLNSAAMSERRSGYSVMKCATKRLLRAEEQANKLSVKMLMPLALFIFPVVLMVIVLPASAIENDGDFPVDKSLDISPTVAEMQRHQ